MRIEIEHILGVERAEVELAPGTVTEVTGPNASGKTSVAVAAQAVLAQELNPAGVPAPQAKRVYVHEGAEYGSAILVDGGHVVTWRPGSGTIEAPDGRVATPEAVGLIDFTARAGGRARAEQLQAALLPEPAAVLDALREALADYLPADDLVGVLRMVEERGWDAAEGVYADRARRAKGDWREITARTWGLRVAQDWRPDGWLADYDHMTVQTAEEQVVAARDALAALHQVQAVSEAEHRRAEESRARIPDLEKRGQALQAQLVPLHTERDAAGIAVDEAQREVTRLEREMGATHAVHHCPHCQGALYIIDGAIVADAGEAPDFAALAEAQEQMARATTTLHALRQNSASLEAAIREADGELRAARQLAAVMGQVAPPGHDVALVEAEAEVERARDVVRVVRAAVEAARLHETIMRYTEIARAIGPQGVRARMLADGLRRLNAGLGILAQAADWPAMGVDDKGAVTWDGRPIALCSESERWRTQAAMQLTLGAMTGSQAVVLDRADLLDAQERERLNAALARVTGKTGIAVLLCSTSSENSLGIGLRRGVTNIDTHYMI